MRWHFFPNHLAPPSSSYSYGDHTSGISATCALPIWLLDAGGGYSRANGVCTSFSAGQCGVPGTRLWAEYRKRRRAFDNLFKHCRYDPAGSLGYRWECVLRRLDETNAEALVHAIREHISGLT